MALQSSGQISLRDIAAEFGQSTSAQIKLTDYYRGLIVPNTSNNSGIPAPYPENATISLKDFYGASAAEIVTVSCYQTASGTYPYMTYYTGYRGGYGSVSPGSVFGASISEIYGIEPYSGPTTFVVTLSGNRSKSFFTAVTPAGGSELRTANATSHSYNSSLNRTSWSWSGGPSWYGSSSRTATFV